MPKKPAPAKLSFAAQQVARAKNNPLVTIAAIVGIVGGLPTAVIGTKLIFDYWPASHSYVQEEIARVDRHIERLEKKLEGAGKTQ